MKNIDDPEITYSEYFQLAYHSIQEIFEDQKVSEGTRLRTLRKLQSMLDALVDITTDAAFDEHEKLQTKKTKPPDHSPVVCEKGWKDDSGEH